MAVFPNFKKLTLDDRKNIENFTFQYPPYSDFNFTSLFSYDIDNEFEYTFLGKNLVIKFFDYITNEPFCSFLGTDNFNFTAKKIIDYARSVGIKQELKLIPEINIFNQNLSKEFLFIEDRDNFDYIISTNELCGLKGDKYSNKKRLFNHFVNTYKNIKFICIDLSSIKTQNEILFLFNKWKYLRNRNEFDVQHELLAIKKLFIISNERSTNGFGMYYENELIGFVIDDISRKDCVVGSFMKGNTNYKGIYEALHINASMYYKDKNYHYINLEQDLGIGGLRLTKEQWNPILFLKKYKVTLQSTI